jgi:hypothetical protein
LGECLPGTGILDSLPASGPLAPFQPAALVPVILVDNIWYGIGDLRARYSLPLLSLFIQGLLRGQWVFFSFLSRPLF